VAMGVAWGTGSPAVKKKKEKEGQPGTRKYNRCHVKHFAIVKKTTITNIVQYQVKLNKTLTH